MRDLGAVMKIMQRVLREEGGKGGDMSKITTISGRAGSSHEEDQPGHTF